MNIGGKKVPSWALWGGGIGVVLVGYIYLKNRGSSSSSPAAAAAGTVTDPSTGQTYPADASDPATGMTYASEIATYGSVAAAESSGSAYGLAGSYSGYAGTAGYPTSNVYPQVNTTGYSTNAQWAQAVQAGLGNLGYDPTTVASALGLYLTNMPLPAADVSIVQAAVAEYGPPPVGSFAIIAQGNGTGSGGATITVPNVVGLDVAQASQVLDSAGLKASGPAGVQGVIHTVTGQSPKAGSVVAHGTTVMLSFSSKGTPAADLVTVPNTVGQEQEAAFAIIEAAGLRPKGPAPVRGRIHIVTGQNPRAGSKAARGSTVTVTSRLK